ncbi:hypothetical protein GCM10028778_16890 [Barrientosiimonas marina]|uniref:Uncharacterized protein n=1 Tax=Lentibacillus kimchii TaxID=1542911 RepID=A0ABW2UWJ2_9BACI
MKRTGLFLLIISFIMLLSACSGDGETPAITDKAIQEANNTIHDEAEVRDSSIDVSEKDEEIIFILQVDASTSKQRAQELSEAYIKKLAAGVAETPDNVSDPPEKDSLGGLYDHYDIRAGVKNPSDEWLLEGGKIGSASGIIWE